LAWGLSLLICAALSYSLGVQKFFLCLPGWPLAGAIYLAASRFMQRAAEVTGEDA